MHRGHSRVPTASLWLRPRQTLTSGSCQGTLQEEKETHQKMQTSRAGQHPTIKAAPKPVSEKEWSDVDRRFVGSSYGAAHGEEWCRGGPRDCSDVEIESLQSLLRVRRVSPKSILFEQYHAVLAVCSNRGRRALCRHG